MPFNTCGFCLLGSFDSFDIASIIDFHGCAENIAIKFGALQNSGISRTNQSPFSVMIPSENTCWTSHVMGQFSFTAWKNLFLLWKSSKLSQGAPDLSHTTPLFLICWKSVVDSSLALLCFMPKTIWSIINLLCKED